MNIACYWYVNNNNKSEGTVYSARVLIVRVMAGNQYFLNFWWLLSYANLWKIIDFKIPFQGELFICYKMEHGCKVFLGRSYKIPKKQPSHCDQSIIVNEEEKLSMVGLQVLVLSDANICQ